MKSFTVEEIIELAEGVGLEIYPRRFGFVCEGDICRFAVRKDKEPSYYGIKIIKFAEALLKEVDKRNG